VTVFRKAVELDLSRNIHDALIAQTCIQHSLPLATLDARQHGIAKALGADSTYLLAG
jgi:predicted nucleic acid-binding protein